MDAVITSSDEENELVVWVTAVKCMLWSLTAMKRTSDMSHGSYMYAEIAETQ